jgi:hypothetical protein
VSQDNTLLTEQTDRATHHKSQDLASSTKLKQIVDDGVCYATPS